MTLAARTFVDQNPASWEELESSSACLSLRDCPGRC